MMPTPDGEELRRLVGNRLRVLRRSRRLTQQMLAGSLHVPQSYISEVETGTVNVSLDQITRILHALGCDPLDVVRSAAPSTGAR